MFDKVNQAAEKLATNVSRRGFLGRLGQGALATAGVLGATLAFGGRAQASPCPCPAGYFRILCGHWPFQPSCSKTPPPQGCILICRS